MQIHLVVILVVEFMQNHAPTPKHVHCIRILTTMEPLIACIEIIVVRLPIASTLITATIVDLVEYTRKICNIITIIYNTNCWLA